MLVFECIENIYLVNMCVDCHGNCEYAWRKGVSAIISNINLCLENWYIEFLDF